MELERNCAFQYVKKSQFGAAEIICDEENLTLIEAKQLWNNYFSDCAKHIKSGGTSEMAIFMGSETSSNLNTFLHISTDAESDGVDIWETRREYFISNFGVPKT